MHLDSVTGLLTWTPTQSQDNTTNLITVTVTDNGTPPLSDSQTIAVVVSPVNHAPVLAAIGKQTGVVLQTLVITNTATDSDLPAQTLTYNFAAVCRRAPESPPMAYLAGHRVAPKLEAQIP